MTSGPVNILLILIGVTVCLTVGTSGEEVRYNEVLSGPDNNLKEDALKFNIVKKEAIPEAKRRPKSKGNGKKASKRPNGKGNKGGKVRNGKGKGNKERKGKGKKGGKVQKGKGNKGRKGKGKGGEGGKVRKGKGKKGRKGEGKKGGKVRKGRGDEGCAAPGVAKQITESIKSYRKYFNHEKKITRTINKATQLKKKGDTPAILVQFAEAADELKHVTMDGTKCPANSSLNDAVIEAVANLTICADSAISPITLNCKTSLIADFTETTADEAKCKSEYTPWIAAFQDCLASTDPSCKCYVDLNTTPKVSNDAPHSCKNPKNPTPDWIIAFETATKKALKDCKGKLGGCRALLPIAAKLTSECCENADSGASTTGAGKRRFKHQALLKSQFKKIMNH